MHDTEIDQMIAELPEDATDEDRAMLEDLKLTISEFGEMNRLLIASGQAGGPSTLAGWWRQYMMEFKVGRRALSIATGIPTQRIRTLIEELDGPTPYEVDKISNFFLPKLEARDKKEAMPVPTTRSKLREKMEARKLAKKEKMKARKALFR